MQMGLPQVGALDCVARCFDEGKDCEAGTYDNDGSSATACVPCPEGHWCAGASAEPQACPLGGSGGRCVQPGDVGAQALQPLAHGEAAEAARSAVEMEAAHNHAVRWDTRLPGVARFFTEDPWGNRLEFCTPLPAETLSEG